MTRTVEEHVAGMARASDDFARSAAEAGAEAPVPTCPAWTVRTLVAHQGMVHRWARANLLREDCHPPDWNAEGQGVADPVGWLLEGVDSLVETLRSVPDDVPAMVFLHDAPPPRVFWARRQCHETTIHAVDALAASLGRPPTEQDAGWVAQDVALDGIDELLTGFLTRGIARFRGVGPLTFSVQPTGPGRGWTVQVGQDGAVRTTRSDPAGDRAAETSRGHPVLSGSAPALYLTLWNRAATGTVDDPGDLLPLWRERARVRWS